MTERQKTLLWKKVQGKRNRFVKRLQGPWKAALMEQIQPVLREIDPSSVTQIADRVDLLIQEDPVEGQMDKTHAVVGVYFARETFNQISKHWEPSRILKEDIPTDQQWINTVKHELGKTAGRRITEITGTSKDEAVKIIKATLQEAAQQGLGASQMSQLLRDELNQKWGKISTYRAARIARTETTQASNLGSLVGAQQTGEPMLKVWLSARDFRTRRDHRGGKYPPGRFDHYDKYPSGPDGEKVEMEDRFVKTGEPMKYPGDYAGSPGNVIHCRCTLYYEPKIQDQTEDVIEPTVTPPKPPVIPRPPKPTPPPIARKITRKQKVEQAKKALAELEENSPSLKKSKQIQLEIDDINQEQKALRVQINEYWDKMYKTERGSPEWDALNVKRSALSTRFNDIQSKKVKLIGQKKKLLNEGVAAEVTKILGLGEGSNLDVQIVKGTGKARAIEVNMFKEVMGNVQAKYGLRTLEIKSSRASKRAFCSNNQANVFAGDGVATCAHELGHAAEHWTKELQEGAKDFLEARCKGEKLTDIYGNGREWAWEDKFLNHYTGKLYARGGSRRYAGQEFRRDMLSDTYGTETFSMWWSEVYEDPTKFVTKDPHYFEFYYNLILKMQGLE